MTSLGFRLRKTRDRLGDFETRADGQKANIIFVFIRAITLPKRRKNSENRLRMNNDLCEKKNTFTNTYLRF